MPHLYLARQPIYDKKLDVYAYELLYRAADEESAPAGIGEQATYTVLMNALTEIGLQDLVGNSLAFVNITREFLVKEDSLPFPGDRIVLEVLEDIVVDEQTLAGVRMLAGQGYMIALDDFVYEENMVELVKLADLIKLDVMALDRDDVRRHVELLRPYDVKLVAEKVETQEEFEFCKELGFDYYQGYFFCKPKTLKRQRLPANRLAVMQLLAKLQDPEIDIGELSELITHDVSMSFRLLRYVNSAMFAHHKKVESIRYAVVMLGLKAMKQFAMVLAMSNINDKPHELLVTALLRARMCELLAVQRNDLTRETLFTVGLLSVLDALLDMQMDELLASLSMADEINAALLTREGEAGAVLECVIAYEQGRWDDAAVGIFDPDQLHNAYFEAVSWSDAVAAEISQPA